MYGELETNVEGKDDITLKVLRQVACGRADS
jgi:hypothetical protein